VIVSDETFRMPNIYGGIQRSQAAGRYELYICGPESSSGVFGTLGEIRAVIEAMQENLAYYEQQAASRATAADEGAGG
jgi:hypothetical protein